MRSKRMGMFQLNLKDRQSHVELFQDFVRLGMQALDLERSRIGSESRLGLPESRNKLSDLLQLEE